jgi:AbiTii
MLLDEIIKSAIDDNTGLPSLLRKCLLLAHELKNDKLKAWAEYELNGYPNEASLPSYREVLIRALGNFVGPAGSSLKNAQLAVTNMDDDHRHWAERSPLMQPIAAYDTGKDAEGKPNGGRMPWPPELVAIYATKFYQGMRMISAEQQIPGTVFVSVMDTVRTKILQLALELKDEIGDAEASGGELHGGRVDQSVVNHIYNGNVVVAANAENFSQVQNISVVQNDVVGLVSALHELGLLPNDVQRLKKAIADDAKTGSKTIGKKTAEWLKELPLTLGKGTLRVGFEVAKALATKYVMGYFGIGV